jgi:hypothetical protein
MRDEVKEEYNLKGCILIARISKFCDGRFGNSNNIDVITSAILEALLIKYAAEMAQVASYTSRYQVPQRSIHASKFV